MEKKKNITITNNKELDGNWSTEYHLNKKLGKEPYIIKNYQISDVKKSSDLKNAIYLKKDDAKILKNLGEGIADLVSRFNEFKNKVI